MDGWTGLTGWTASTLPMTTSGLDYEGGPASPPGPFVSRINSRRCLPNRLPHMRLGRDELRREPWETARSNHASQAPGHRSLAPSRCRWSGSAMRAEICRGHVRLDQFKHDGKGAGAIQSLGVGREERPPSAGVFPLTLYPPSSRTLCGSMPMWPITAIPSRISASTCAMRATPPSSFTAWAPASRRRRRIRHRLFRGLVRANREVGDDRGPFRRARHGPRVVEHLVHRHRGGVRITEHHHPERVADK